MITCTQDMHKLHHIMTHVKCMYASRTCTYHPKSLICGIMPFINSRTYLSIIGQRARHYQVQIMEIGDICIYIYFYICSTSDLPFVVQAQHYVIWAEFSINHLLGIE